MKRIAIISCSVREGRLSHRVSLSVQKYLETNALAETDMLDLNAYDFPLFRERLKNQQSPDERTLDFARRFGGADGILIVTPVYNGSFPASLKNVIDLLQSEWHRKPFGVISVTDGTTPGIATIQQIQTILLKLGALAAPKLCTALSDGNFSESGSAEEGRFAETLVKELLWLIERVSE